MDTTARPDSAAFALDWSVSVTAATGETAAALTLTYEIEAREEIYVTDRLWLYDAERRRIADPMGVYRYVIGDRLRLVLAQAAYAPNLVPRNIFAPLSSRIRAGATRRRDVEIALPVDEYSALARDISKPSVIEHVSKIDFVIGVRPRSDMADDPAPPLGVSESMGYHVLRPELVVSTRDVAALPVRRRTVYMPRFALPGEPQPAPAPRPTP